MSLEKDFRVTVRKSLKLLKFCKVYPIQQTSIAGHPDIFLCLNSYFITLELKNDSTSVTSKIQKYHIDHHNHCGGYSFKVDPTNWKEIFKLLRFISKKPKRKKWRLQDA